MIRMMMAAGVLALLASPAAAQYGSRGSSYGNSYGGGFGTGSNPRSHNVDGYIRNNGTYVPPHQSTNPNSTQMDNYGTRGNYNPNTGSFGTRSPRY